MTDDLLKAARAVNAWYCLALSEGRPLWIPLVRVLEINREALAAHEQGSGPIDIVETSAGPYFGLENTPTSTARSPHCPTCSCGGPEFATVPKEEWLVLMEKLQHVEKVRAALRTLLKSLPKPQVNQVSFSVDPSAWYYDDQAYADAYARVTEALK